MEEHKRILTLVNLLSPIRPMVSIGAHVCGANWGKYGLIGESTGDISPGRQWKFRMVAILVVDGRCQC